MVHKVTHLLAFSEAILDMLITSPSLDNKTSIGAQLCKINKINNVTVIHVYVYKVRHSLEDLKFNLKGFKIVISILSKTHMFPARKFATKRKVMFAQMLIEKKMPSYIMIRSINIWILL